ncbi:MAG: acyl-protein synthetase LuxE [Elusimicrobia bacterium]|nr:acyl-protein synthetase LuxE [Elusimicrobiota bacterium]
MTESIPSLPNAEKICRIREPHVWSEEKSRLMVAACREMAMFHERRCPELSFLYRRRGFDPASLKEETDIGKLPMLGVTAMKRYLLTSLPQDRAALKLTSSGTRGQKTQIWFDPESLDRCQAMLSSQWEEEGLVSQEPTNYLMFVYDPREAKDLGIAFSDKNQQRFAPVARSFYAIRKNPQGEWAFQKQDALRALREFSTEGRPVRIFGIPSFIHDLLDEISEPIVLPPGSWMVTGGGWKAAEDKRVSRDFFRRRASESFGLPLERIRDGYGMAEHSAPYIECRRHRFHVPAYCRVLIRDPLTLEPAPPGRTGLLELVAPYNAMMPNLAILSTDMGFHHEDPCPCGYNSPTFALVGRGGLTKHKGCAIHAGEIVQRN